MRYLFSANLDGLNKVFKQTVDVITDVAKDSDINKKTALSLAKDLTKTIDEKYEAYISSANYTPYVHGKPDMTTQVVENSKGDVIVRILGPNVIYEEYGTGTRGLKHPHPRHDTDGVKPYGSGRNVIRGTTQVHVTYYTKKKYGKVKWIYINKNNGKRTPYWYPLYLDGLQTFPNDFNDGMISSSDYVWKHNGVITKGLPAGKFVYDSCQAYKASTGLSGKEILGRTMKQYIKAKFKNKMKKDVITSQLNDKQRQMSLKFFFENRKRGM